MAEAARETGLDERDVEQLLKAAGNRARTLLRLASSPVTVTTEGATDAEGVAGVLTVAPGFELEVIPKFLSPTNANWREDFFALATISQYGHVLPRDAVDASATVDQSLPALLARAVVHMYWQNHRRPLRTYERRELNPDPPLILGV